MRNLLMSGIIFCLPTNPTLAMESLQETLGEPTLETTDSVLASTRCGALSMALIAPYIRNPNTKPEEVPEKVLGFAELVMPFVQKHLRIHRSIRENPRLLSTVDFYLNSSTEELKKEDLVYCGMWAYWNVQKYGLQ